MSTDLYKTLGVSKGADKKAIRKAYLNRAKKTHPDSGGNKDKFALVKKAYDILSDEERRKRYDDLGDDSDTVDNSQGDAIQTVAHYLNLVLQDCANGGRSPIEIDIMSSIRSKINSGISEAQKQIRIAKQMLDIDKKMKGRFKSKGENIMESILISRFQALENQIKNQTLWEEKQKNALEMIKDFTFKYDSPAYESPGDRMMRMMGATTYMY